MRLNLNNVKMVKKMGGDVIFEVKKPMIPLWLSPTQIRFIPVGDVEPS